MNEGRIITITLTGEDGVTPGRTVRIPSSFARRILLLAGAALLFGALMAGSWWFLAARAFQASGFEARIAEMERDLERVEELAGGLAELEGAYERVRSLFGASESPSAGALWLPPVSGGGGARTGGASEGDPFRWPLTERGFVTQGLLEGGGLHPGIDIAVSTGSWVLAAADGFVADAGEDPVYGLYLRVDHSDEYRTVYGHASLLLAATGDSVRQGEVIALTGSSGRSTAPHLHFELLQGDTALDPLDLLVRP